MLKFAPYPVLIKSDIHGQRFEMPDDADPIWLNPGQLWMPHETPYRGRFQVGQSVYVTPWLQGYKGCPPVAIVTRVRGFQRGRRQAPVNQIEIGGFPCQWSADGHFEPLL